MNRIYGRIVLKDTVIGIPDLLVVLYDVDPRTLPEEWLAGGDGDKAHLSDAALRGQGFPGDRIGSVLTDQTGAFEFVYKDKEFQIRNPAEKRPDLFLLVMSPDEPDKDLNSQILYMPSVVRQNAGRSEQYLIRVTPEQLEAVGMRMPASNDAEPEEPQEFIERVVETEEARLQLEEGIRQIYVERIERKREIGKKFQAEARKPLLQSLSTIPAAAARPETFISGDEDGEAVTGKTMEAIKVRLTEVINKPSSSGARAPVGGYVALTPEQEKALRDAATDHGNGRISNVPEAKVEEILGTRGDGTKRPTYMLAAANPVVRQCHDGTVGDKCLDGSDISGQPQPGTPGEGRAGLREDRGDDAEDEDSTKDGQSGRQPAGSGIDLVSADGIPRYIASLVEHIDPTDSPVPFGEKKRAEQQDVQSQIDQLALRAGPADVPAFYDFHNLQIAFENVWQEAIDRGVLDAAEGLYEQMVELGGEPPTGGHKLFVAHVEWLLAALRTEPDPDVIQFFDVSPEQWNILTENQKESLRQIASLFLKGSDLDVQVIGQQVEGLRLPFSALHPQDQDFHVSVGDEGDPFSLRILGSNFRSLQRYFAQLRQRGERILQYAQRKLDALEERRPIQDFSTLHSTLRQLKERLNSDYAFTGFAAKDGRYSINFGLLLTYRQRWEPQTYQAGELVKTVTLAPKEIRKFTKKTVRKRKRAEKEVDNNLYSRREESTVTSRIEAEIVRNAQAKTNFNTTANGGFTAGVWNVNMQAAFGAEASKSSNETKKEFREAVHKAAEEYKSERKTEVTTEETFDDEFTESGEIMNPNDELAVTFLFYELQRRYKVSERLHRVLPVVLVAQEIPNPADIDEDWIAAHDWILRRVLLDDSFVPALNYLATNVVGDEFSLKVMKKHVEEQRRLVNALQEEVVEYRDLVGQRYTALQRAIDRSARAAEDDDDGFLESVGEFIFGDDTSAEASRVRERAARDAYEKAMQDERDLMARLNRAAATHNAATEAYAEQLGQHLNRRAQIARLQVHIKQNILYYMQAIWLHEPPDQRFLRLHKVEVPVFEGEKTYRFKPSSNPYARPALSTDVKDMVLANPHEYEVDVEIDPDFATKPLVEVADLDNLLGFKGNYMIFRLRESNALTEFMIEPYVKREFNTIYDPDVEGSMTLDEFADFVCCLSDELEPEAFDRIKPELEELLARLLQSPLRDNEEIVVPTDSLFIEALPGKHPILEDFKLMHRAIDVNMADAQHREQMLENIRRVARLLGNQLEDPEIEAKYVFEGNGSATIVSPSGRTGGDGD